MQASRKQLQLQLKFAKQQLDAASKSIAADKRELAEKKKAESKTCRVGLDRFGMKTQRGTGDNSAQSTINALQVKIAAAEADVAKKQAEVTRLEQQILALDLQIVALDPGYRAPALASASTPDGAVEITPKKQRGYTVGKLSKSSVLRLQYVSGTWKAWGRQATARPDDETGERVERNRLVIACAGAGGAERVLAIVPPGTATTPFEFTAPADLECVWLRINDGDGDFASNPDGHVKYRVEVLAAK